MVVMAMRYFSALHPVVMSALISFCMIADVTGGENDDIAELSTMYVSGQTLKRIPIEYYSHLIRNAKQAVQGRDYEKAFELLSQTARMGDKESQYLLGMLYLKALEVKQQPILGYAWIKLSVEGSDGRPWRKQVRYIESLMSQEDKRTAESLIDELRSKYGIEQLGMECHQKTRRGSHIKVTVCDWPTKLNNQTMLVRAEPLDDPKIISSPLEPQSRD